MDDIPIVSRRLDDAAAGFCASDEVIDRHMELFTSGHISMMFQDLKEELGEEYKDYQLALDCRHYWLFLLCDEQGVDSIQLGESDMFSDEYKLTNADTILEDLRDRLKVIMEKDMTERLRNNVRMLMEGGTRMYFKNSFPGSHNGSRYV
jgi:hypothetical protein